MTAFLTILSIFAYLWLFLLLLNRTFLAIAPGRHQISGAVFLFNNSLFILPALLVVPLVGPENIRILHYVTSDSVFGINAIVLYSLGAFTICLGVISAFFGRMLFYDLRRVYEELNRPAVAARVLAFNRIIMISIPVAIAVNLTIFGGQHALFSASFYDLNPGAIRHMNESSTFSGYAKHYFQVTSLLMAPLLALPLYRARRTERWLALVLIFAALTSHGSKSPVIYFLIVFLFALLEKGALNKGGSGANALFAPKRVFMAVAAMSGIFVIFYFLAINFFLGDSRVFWDYFWNRAFVGQMAGVYEQFNLLLYDPAFTWHAVPFASFFVDYPNFHKELMLISENRVDPDRIGIKITFFAAEAYGMFGWTGVIVAPFLLAFQFVLTFLILNTVIDRLILRSPEVSKYVTAFFFASYFSFTDGISEMLFYKGAFLFCILITPVVICMVVRGTWLSQRYRAIRPMHV